MESSRADGRGFPVVNPANESVIGHAVIVDPQMLEAAVAAAKAAFAEWRNEAWTTRSALLLALAGVIRDNADELARLVTLEQGKPIGEAAAEIDFCVSLFEHYAGKELPANILKKTGDAHVEQFFSPFGVVAAIVPWNFPLLTAVMKIAPALLTGNAVIVKPAPTTPLATLRFGELVKDIVPNGLLQVLGDDGSFGPLLVTHPDIAKISFTGSTKTGKAVMESAAASLKRLTLELGGNDPAIVFADVDPESRGGFDLQGRILERRPGLHGRQAPLRPRGHIRCDVFRACRPRRCGNRRRRTRSGCDHRPGTEQDAVRQALPPSRRGEEQRQDTRRRQCLRGKGYFIRPTIVTGLSDDAPLVAQEQFGPILPVLKFDDEGDVVRRANNSPYGLTASVWSSDLRARLADRAAPRRRNGVDQQASRPRSRLSDEPLQAIGDRRRIRRRGPEGVHPAAADKPVMAGARPWRWARRPTGQVACDRPANKIHRPVNANGYRGVYSGRLRRRDIRVRCPL